MMYRYQFSPTDPILVMGGIESFLSRLLKDKIPWDYGILPYSNFYILINNFTEKFTLYGIIQLLSKCKYFLSYKLSDA